MKAVSISFSLGQAGKVFFVCVCVCGYLCYCRRFAVQISDFLNLLLAVGLLTPTNFPLVSTKGLYFLLMQNNVFSKHFNLVFLLNTDFHQLSVPSETKINFPCPPTFTI